MPVTVGTRGATQEAQVEGVRFDGSIALVYQTQEQMLDAHIQKMGNDLGRLFHAMSNELSWTCRQWRQYRILFGEKEAHLVLLNKSAPAFFNVIHDALSQTTLLGIARLTGPTESYGRQNLSILRFSKAITDKPVRTEVKPLIRKAVEVSAFAKDWRNRRIGHHDLDLALGKGVKPLDVATREGMETSLSAIAAVLNHVEIAYCNSSSIYDVPSPWDAHELLNVIEAGLLKHRERLADHLAVADFQKLERMSDEMERHTGSSTTKRRDSNSC